MSDFPHLGLPLELRAQASGQIEGMASPFGSVDAYGDTVMPGAFSKSISSGDRPLMLWAHAMDRVIGRWEHLEERTDGLHVRGQLNLRTEAGRDAFEHVRAGDLNGLSIGFRIPKGGASVDRKTGRRELREIDLAEISIVAMPAAKEARVRHVKHLDTMEELRTLLRDAGLPHRAAEKIATHGWAALRGMDPEQFEREARNAARKAAAARDLQSVAELLGRYTKGS